MKTLRHLGLRHTVLALAVLAAFPTTRAQTTDTKSDAAPSSEAKADETKKASDVQASASAGVGWVSGDKADRAIFGQYNGMRDRDVYGLFGFTYDRRNEATGSWVQMQGANLGLDTRELGFLWKRQGNWGVAADYGELVRREIYTVNTGLIGAGGAAPGVVLLGAPRSGYDLDLETKRKGGGLGFSKWIGSAFLFDLGVRTERKEGARLFGIGMNCPSIVASTCGASTLTNTGTGVLFLPEPIDSNHTQIEARLNYGGQRLQLSGGYYGSLYDNSYGRLAPIVPGTLNNPLGTPLPLSAGLQSILSNPVALPPDNQAHHFDITGNYAVTQTIRANFKLAYARATQDQSFGDAGLAGAPAGVDNLDGKIDTTLAQLGISARPVKGLTLLAEGRYEDRDDKTPIALYNVQGASAYTNRDYSREKIRGKLQASYNFLTSYSGTIGADYERIDREAFTPTSAVSGVSALRLETEEIGYRIELRRRMTETFSGAVSFLTSERDGSNWLRPNSGLGVTEVTDPATGFAGTAVFSPTLADRRRERARLAATWQPTDTLSVQLSGEAGRDKYSTPTDYAVRKTRTNFYSVDLNYALTDAWSVNGFAARGTHKLDQARPAGSIIDYDNTSTNVGLGVNGKIGERFDLGGGLSYLYDKSEYAQGLDPNAPPASAALLAAAGGLPDIVFKVTEARVFGRYALTKRSSVRLDAIHQRARFNDWTYEYAGVPFTYSDNTTLSLKPVQNVTFVGLTYTYLWQ